MNAHPLRPLTPDELVAACAAARTEWHARNPDAEADLRFPIVAVAEPTRPELRAWTADPGAGPLPRRIEVVVVERRSGTVVEAVVDVERGAVHRWDVADGAVPILLFDEAANAIGAVMGDARWLAAMASRGITDVSGIQIDPWPAGNFGLPGEEGRRLARCVSYVRGAPDDNGYARPVEGLVAVVDLAANTVVSVTDSGAVPIPAGPGRYGAADHAPARAGLKPIAITQPEGPSFTLEDNKLRWLGWSLRFSVHPVEGLVLHQLAYDGRPVLDRASIAEMVVPYGATGENHWWKNAFDAGEWGLGRMVATLTNGCDCLGEIRYAEAVLPDEFGGAQTKANAVCIHEEDVGILWKHVDLWTGKDEVRRSRRLVVSSIATVGNYEYGFYWCFYLDGTVELEVKLTGILQTGACPPEATEAPDHGIVLEPGLWAPHHQHLFCARLDVAVDGPANRVEEVDIVGAEPGPGNEWGNAMVAERTVLATEQQAQRLADARRNRRWRVVNPQARTAYVLTTSGPATLIAHPSSSVARRAAFATKNLWVTPYAPDERRPAGNHPNQSGGGDGLPAWTAADRPVVDTELVVWHTFGVTHVARPEDFPVMPVERVGFSLRPDGFFPRNPALDLPPSSAHCAQEGGPLT